MCSKQDDAHDFDTDPRTDRLRCVNVYVLLTVKFPLWNIQTEAPQASAEYCIIKVRTHPLWTNPTVERGWGGSK